MKQQVFSIILQPEPEGGYTVTVPALPGCVTHGATVEEAKEMSREAIELYLESLEQHNEPWPEVNAPLVTSVELRYAKTA